MTGRDMPGQSRHVPSRDGRDTGDTPFRGGVPVSPTVTPRQTAERLQKLSRRLGRLFPNWNNPETFFEERDEIEREIRKIEREIRRG